MHAPRCHPQNPRLDRYLTKQNRAFGRHEKIGSKAEKQKEQSELANPWAIQKRFNLRKRHVYVRNKYLIVNRNRSFYKTFCGDRSCHFKLYPHNTYLVDRQQGFQ